MSNQEFVRSILETLKSVLPKERNLIGLHEPYFAGNEWNYVKDCIDTAWVSSVGKYVDQFEQELANFTGVKKAVAVVNGTAALHICFKLVGVESNDEVLVPALTFVATANAVAHAGAIPHFVDSEEKTLGIDPFKLDDYLNSIADINGEHCINKFTGRRIRAVVPMHTFGHPVDIEPLLDVCIKYKLQLVEDAAESLGSYYKGRHAGNWGRVSAFSFNGNKTVTTGGGGAIITNDETLAKLAKHITTTAKIPHKWAFNHDIVGYNYRLPNINAALGCAQLEQLPDFISKKRMLAKRYSQAFADVKGVTVFLEDDYSTSNYWLNALILDDQHSQFRDELLAITNENGIMTRPVWSLMHKLPMYQSCPRMDLTISESLESKIINVPSSVFL